jgi:spore germination cell wall hydrolase CwlJ-like protein
LEFDQCGGAQTSRAAAEGWLTFGAWLGMESSRAAWACSAVAPWGIALALLVSITAQADQDPGLAGSALVHSASFDGKSPYRQQRSWDGMDNAHPLLTPAHLTTGEQADLGVIPDEIEPNGAVKPSRIGFPAINRARKSDPFIGLRPGLDARLPRPKQVAAARADREADWPEESRSPAALDSVQNPPIPPFSDGATPAMPLAAALNSSTPIPSDALVLAGPAKLAAPTTVAAKTDAAGKPNYSSLIDPKDAGRQMRCLAEAIYFESRSEPENGQAAVAQVVLNRVRSGIFPTDVCGVVYQDRNRPFACQFSFACEGKSLRIEEPGAWAVATRISQEVVTGANFNPKVAEALNYHANYVSPFWISYLKRVDRIGAHIFYAMRPGANWAPGALNGRGDLPPLTTAAR